MDCFNTHYYWLNRKLLVLMGQWPYQNRAERIKKLIAFFCIIILQFVIQIGQAVNVDIDFDYGIELIAENMVLMIVSMRYFSYTLQIDKIKGLLNKIKLTWQSMTDTDERQILCQCTEEGRLYILRYTTIMFSQNAINTLIMLMSPLLVYTPFTNTSCPILMMYIPDFFIDTQEYCFPLLVGLMFFISTLLAGLLAIDMLYIAILYHAIGLFKIVCYRLEHLFDNYTEEPKPSFDRRYVRERVVCAVKQHRTAMRFCNDIVATYEWMNLVGLLLVLLSIGITLYWTVTAKGEVFKTWLNMTFSLGQLAHIFILVVPAQRMIDNSGAVTFKAYSSLWYKRHAKEQSMLLLTMQRGLKPSAMVVGKMYELKLENFATEIKASFSYFTLLMSFR